MNDKARLTLTPDDVREVLRHCHWIAMKNGAADLFVSRNYPGYALSNLVDTLKRGGEKAAIYVALLCRSCVFKLDGVA